MVVASSEQLVDRVDGTFGASVATRHGKQSIHEAVLRMRGLEARYRPKVIGGRIDTLAAPECGDDVRRPVPESERGHVDERAIVRFEREAQIELEHAVRSQKRPISAAGAGAVVRGGGGWDGRRGSRGGAVWARAAGRSVAGGGGGEELGGGAPPPRRTVAACLDVAAAHATATRRHGDLGVVAHDDVD